MKFLKIDIAIFLAMVITFTYSLISESSFTSVESKVFRFHVLANSNESYDQELKLLVKDEVFLYITELTKHLDTNEEAKKVIAENLDKIQIKALEIVRKNGYNYEVCVEITNEFYDTRVYENFSLPAGYYDGLRIEIGNALGDNWWCVLFPPLCSDVATKDLTKEDLDFITKEKYEYRFKVVDVFNEVREFLA